MLVQFISSFIASAAFAVLFNTPRKFLIACGASGMIGWMVYILMSGEHTGGVAASLVASCCVALLSQLFARLHKAPITLFSASGIIPLVPGGLAYSAMLNFVNNDYNMAVQFAAKAFLMSGAIAAGLLFAEVLYRAILQVVRAF